MLTLGKWQSAVLVALVLTTWFSRTSAGERKALSAMEARGKQIYLTGESLSGKEITAHVGHGAIPMPASGLPCGSCHGADGLGRPEGGVIPSNITWSHLTKPYGTVSAGGQKRPAYTVDTLAKAITVGVDSAGNRLDVSMPRYRMAADDLKALIAYLKQVESELDAGLTDDSIVLGTIVPSAAPMKSLGEAMRAVMEAYFADINDQGGIYGRKLRLKVGAAETRMDLLDKGKHLVEDGKVFALVGAFTAGVDKEYAELVEQQGIPLVGPYTLFNQDDDSPQRFTFYLQAGLTTQARALVDYAARKMAGRKAQSAVVCPPDSLWPAVAEAVAAQAARHQWPKPVKIDFVKDHMDSAAMVRRLKESHVEALFFFSGAADWLALAREAERAAWTPYVFLSGSLTGEEIFKVPSVFQNKIFLAYAMDPSDQTQAGVAEFAKLQQRHGLKQSHMLAQIATYAAAKVLVEGLKRAGRDLSRAKLIAALEKMYHYETGLTPKVTYNANRRVGALGAHIVAVDLEQRNFASASQWVGLE